MASARAGKLAVGAVKSEPFSSLSSLLNREYTGNFSVFPVLGVYTKPRSIVTLGA